MQKAKIRTDEEGLETAAMTMVMMAEGAALEPEEPQFAKVCPAMVETVAELLEKSIEDTHTKRSVYPDEN